MPPGCLHAVATLSRPDENGPTIMKGFHFLSAYTLEQTLEAAMRHSLWHGVWANITHDDVDIWKARILAMILLILGHDASNRKDILHPANLRALPLDEQNLFSLLFMAENYPYFLSHSSEEVTKNGLFKFSPYHSMLLTLGSGKSTRKPAKPRPQLLDHRANMLGEARESMRGLAMQLIARLPPAALERWEAFRKAWVYRFAEEAQTRQMYWEMEERDAALEVEMLADS